MKRLNRLSVKRGLHAALFWWAATVVWNWRYVADDREVEADRLQCANSRFAACAWPSDEDLHFLEAMSHGLT